MFDIHGEKQTTSRRVIVWITIDKEKTEQKWQELKAALIAVNGRVMWITNEIGLVEIYIPIDDDGQEKSDLSALEGILVKCGFKRMGESNENPGNEDVV